MELHQSLGKNKVKLIFLYKKASHFPADLARFCMWDPTAIPFGLLLQELCGGKHENSCCFNKPVCYNAWVWNLAPVTVSGKVPDDSSTARISRFYRACELSPTTVCHVFYASLGFEWTLLRCQLELYFLLCAMHIGWKKCQHLVSLLFYTSLTIKLLFSTICCLNMILRWAELKVYFACSVGSTVCIGFCGINRFLFSLIFARSISPPKAEEVKWSEQWNQVSSKMVVLGAGGSKKDWYAGNWWRSWAQVSIVLRWQGLDIDVSWCK